MTIELTPEMLSNLINEEIEKFNGEKIERSSQSTELTLKGLRRMIKEEMSEMCGMVEPGMGVEPRHEEMPIYEEEGEDESDESADHDLDELLEDELESLEESEGDDELSEGDGELSEGDDELSEGDDELSEGDDEIKEENISINENVTTDRWKLLAGI